LTNHKNELIYNHMVIYQDEKLDLVFGALANTTRREILKRLSGEDHSVMELVGLFDISQPAVTKHLNVLEEAGLIQRQKEGRFRHCHFLPDPLQEASDWTRRVREHWEERLDALDRYLKDYRSKEELG
jgi:DNA-binding transcriptional ArsR family regulator